MKSASASDAVRITLPRVIDLLAKEHLDHLRRRLSASPNPSAAAAAAAEEVAESAPDSATEPFSMDKLTGNQSSLKLLNAALREERNVALMAARKQVGAVCLSVGKAMISKSIRGFSEFLGNLHFDESIRRVWEQEPAALMVMKLLKQRKDQVKRGGE
jgi:hypothetical protein